MNRWLADRNYGSGMALAFEGDEDFLRRSVNFAVNYLVHDPQNVNYRTPSFVTVNTTMERLSKALYEEAFSREMLNLIDSTKYVDNGLRALNDEDFPADFDERCVKFRADLWAASSPKEVAEVLKRDPTRGIFSDEHDPVLEEKAKELARNSVAEQLGSLVYSDFMRHFSTAGLHIHDVVETA